MPLIRNLATSKRGELHQTPGFSILGRRNETDTSSVPNPIHRLD